MFHISILLYWYRYEKEVASTTNTVPHWKGQSHK